jgi:uncharacterized protein YbaR (Trm112 family)
LFIELAEILVCPLCRPRHDEGTLQGLVAMVGELDDRRVTDGWLGCPACEARYPIRDGVIFFASASPEASERVSSGPEATRPSPGSARQPTEPALLVAALLSLHEVGGTVLLGKGFEATAGELSKLAAGSEIVALLGQASGPDPRSVAGVTLLSGAYEKSLPLRAASVSAAALHDPMEEAIAEVARVLRPAGRLAVFGCGPERQEEVLDLIRAAGLDPVVVDPRALVARRL